MSWRPSLLLCAAFVLEACGAGSPGPAERGASAAEEGLWEEAYTEFTRAVGREPSRLDLRRQRVRAALSSGRLPELDQLLRDQISSDDSSPAVTYELALTVAITGEPGSDAQAITLLSQVVDHFPNEGDVPFRIGLLRIEQESYREALEPLLRAVEIDESNARYRVAYAAALAHSHGREDEAREVLAELPGLEPSGDDLQRARGILAGLNNPTSRVPLSLRESYREAVIALSEDEASTGAAVQLIEEALETAPTCAPFVVLNGLASVRLGQLGWARAAFLRAVELWPNDPTPWLELAALDEDLENLADAEDNYGRALEVDPLSVDGWTELGRIRYQRRRYPEAAEAFSSLLAIDGGRMLSHLWLGRSLRRSGREAEAEQVYIAMLESHPRNFEACIQLGHIYRARRLQVQDRLQSSELRERARHYYRLALDIRPQDPMVQRMLDTLEEGQ